MVTYDVTLEVETAYEMHGSEIGVAYQYFVRGGHFRQAFIDAVIRVFAEERSQRLVVPDSVLRPLIHHSWWCEIDVTEWDANGEAEESRSEYQACSEDATGAFPVTWIWIGEADELGLFVRQCRACADGRHETCEVVRLPTEVPLYQRTGLNSWSYDARPF